MRKWVNNSIKKMHGFDPSKGEIPSEEQDKKSLVYISVLSPAAFILGWFIVVMSSSSVEFIAYQFIGYIAMFIAVILMLGTLIAILTLPIRSKKRRRLSYVQTHGTYSDPLAERREYYRRR